MPHALAVYVAPRPECPGLPNRFAVYVAPRPLVLTQAKRTCIVAHASLWALALRVA